MKIEKLNDNQIRCILDKNDLEQRELQLSELAYGSSKAKALFRDMMEQAASEFGFEVDNIPLMIEAIPVSLDCLILVVTKVEDPEELDTRFSRFSSLLNDENEEDDAMDEMDMLDMEEDVPFSTDMADMEEDMEEVLPFGPGYEVNEDDSAISIGGDDDAEGSVMDIMAPFNKAISKAKEEILKKKNEEKKPKPLGDQVYAFMSLDEVLNLSGQLAAFYQGDSMLYKDETQSIYYLVLLRKDTDEKLYRRACTICADHAEYVETSYASLAYFTEHFKAICDTAAIETLNHLN